MRNFFGRAARSSVCIGILIWTLGGWAEDFEQKVARIHKEAVVIDTHVDTLQRVIYEGVDIGRRLPDGQVDIPRLREGGVDAVFFAVWIDSLFKGPAAVKQTRRLIDAMNQTIARNSDKIGLALRADDIEHLKRSGKIAAFMGIEGGHAIDNDLGLLRIYHQLGVRYMTLTWSNTNDWADSSSDQKRHGGLTDFGRKVVAEMNRIGMIVDISHVSDQTFYDVLKVTKKPVIASHSSCRALANVPRNMSDDMIRALAKNGGVMGINFYSNFIDAEFAKKAAAYGRKPAGTTAANAKGSADLDKLAAAKYKGFITPNPAPRPPMEKLIDHIDHAVKLVGPDYVGLGSDFDGIDSSPTGLEDVSKLPNITRALLRRGYREEDIKKILGGNFLRVFRQVISQ